VVVSQFPGRKMNKDCLKEWTKENFEPVVGYPPYIMTLAKGWLVWVFKTVVEVNQVLHIVDGSGVLKIYF
jgi:hypothetical protein